MKKEQISMILSIAVFIAIVYTAFIAYSKRLSGRVAQLVKKDASPYILSGDRIVATSSKDFDSAFAFILTGDIKKQEGDTYYATTLMSNGNVVWVKSTDVTI
jgi:hypothetical protein